jgi:glutamyl/glutaminyl-tRNA synthetase
MKPRVRFAPSPTGFFHIGSARTALYNWLYSKHTGGTFILRVEDTDEVRSNADFEKLIYDSLLWLGMQWDEGPDVGGPFGPYRQSERTATYDKYLKQLLDSGRAYEKDDFTFFKLEGARHQAYDHYQKRMREFVQSPPRTFTDVVHGDVTRSEDQDFVIRKPNGGYVFHFCNVVDDIEMKITHVIRGQDHLSNTTKHVELFLALGVTPPIYAHIPLILNPDGKKKLSKRETVIVYKNPVILAA